MGKRKTDLASLLALPHVHERDGAAYVRLPYRVGDKWRSKERRVSTPEEAIRAVAELRQLLGQYGSEGISGDRMTFADLLAEYRLAHPEKPRWYVDPLADYFGARLIRSLTYADLRAFREARAALPRKTRRPGQPATDARPRSAATVNREMEVLRAVLLFAVRHGWLLRNPFLAGPPLIRKSQEARRTRLPSPEEEARLIAACVPPREHLRAIVIAARDTGLRRGALQELTWSCVDWDLRLIRVPPGNRHKSRPTVIGLTARLHAELWRLWEGQTPADPAARIFPFGDWKRSWTTACRLAGVEGLRFHDLRHGFATDLLEAGIGERLAMKMAGHSSASTHAIYTNTDARLALSVAAALDDLHAARSEPRHLDKP